MISTEKQKKNTCGKRIITSIVLFVFGLTVSAAPFTQSLQIQKAHAQLAVVEIGPNMLANTWHSFIKEQGLDAAAYALAKQLLRTLVQDVISWINSGFRGSPAFVTDLDGYLLSIADQAAGDFIYGRELGFLCSPFQLNVRAALEIQYQKSKDFGYKSQCTLSGVLQNVQNFAQGLTTWSDWFQVTTRTENNQYGALYLAQTELEAKIVNAQGEEIKLLDFGSGFLSMKECTPIEGGGEHCIVTTPGDVIADQLNKALGAGQDELIAADEINELISALLSQLVQQVLNFGLSSLHQGSSYWTDKGDTLIGDFNDDNPLDGYGPFGNDIKETLDKEEEVAGYYEQIIAAIDDAETFIDELADSANCSVSLPETLSDERETAEEALREQRKLVRELERLNERYTTQGNPIDQYEAFQEYEQMKKDGEFHTDNEIDEIFEHALEVETEAETAKDEAEDKCNA